MRALYLPEIFKTSEIELSKDQVHHFLNVLRLKDREEILLLDGRGNSLWGVLKILGKKSALISKSSEVQFKKRSHQMSALIASTKKEAMESILKNLTEIGFDKIFITETEYSQTNQLKIDRMEKIMIAALEQSNNRYLPEVIDIALDQINFDKFQQCILFTIGGELKKITSIDLNVPCLMIIGPEGGFSDSDLTTFQKIKNLVSVDLPTPILRAPNAASCAAGYLLGLGHKS